MLKIYFHAEHADDNKTPLTIAQALINVVKPPTGISAASEDDEEAIICLEEIANHILLYVDAHRRLMR